MERCHTGYAADYEKVGVTIGSDGSRTEARELFRLYQDAKGRSRMEGSVSGEGQTLRFAWLIDLRGWRGVIIDLDTGHTLVKGPWPRHDTPGGQARDPRSGRPSRRSHGSKKPPEAQTVEDLGEAEIEGLAAHGWRTSTASYVVDVWNAKVIDQPPLLIRRQEASREKTERLFNITLGDPDPALFAPLDELEKDAVK